VTPDGPDGQPLLEIGQVVKPHGLRGEVVVRLVTDRLERLDPGNVLHSSAGDLAVQAARPHQGCHLVVFADVADREAAERLRGTVLLAPALEDPDVLWVHELIGADVVDLEGNGHGRVVAVEANPASDLLVLEGGGLVPLHFLVEASPGRLVVDPPAGLLD
jgi:16S rRNA processing protein RimM